MPNRFFLENGVEDFDQTQICYSKHSQPTADEVGISGKTQFHLLHALKVGTLNFPMLKNRDFRTGRI